MIDLDRVAEHWTGQLAKTVFFIVAFVIVLFGALTMWGLPGPSLPQWFFFGMSPQQSLLAWPLTALAAIVAGAIVSAPFWILALIVQAATKNESEPKPEKPTTVNREN